MTATPFTAPEFTHYRRQAYVTPELDIAHKDAEAVGKSIHFSSAGFNLLTHSSLHLLGVSLEFFVYFYFLHATAWLTVATDHGLT